MSFDEIWSATSAERPWQDEAEVCGRERQPVGPCPSSPTFCLRVPCVCRVPALSIQPFVCRRLGVRCCGPRSLLHAFCPLLLPPLQSFSTCLRSLSTPPAKMNDWSEYPVSRGRPLPGPAASPSQEGTKLTGTHPRAPHMLVIHLPPSPTSPFPRPCAPPPRPAPVPLLPVPCRALRGALTFTTRAQASRRGRARRS